MGDVTLLLEAARGGDPQAADRLYASVYADLRRIARGQLRRGGADPPGATSLVHEVWFRLARPGALELRDREHFYAVAARAMRQIMVDRSRQRQAEKRGGAVSFEPLHQASGPETAVDARDLEVLALDQALARLASVEPALASLVEMRFFAGLELAEIAELVGRSERSLKRDWQRARAFLHAQLEIGGRSAAGSPAL